MFKLILRYLIAAIKEINIQKKLKNETIIKNEECCFKIKRQEGAIKLSNKVLVMLKKIEIFSELERHFSENFILSYLCERNKIGKTHAFYYNAYFPWFHSIAFNLSVYLLNVLKPVPEISKIMFRESEFQPREFWPT